MHIYNDIRNGETSIKKIEEHQKKKKKKIRSKLNEVITKNPKYWLKDQSDRVKNSKTLYDSRENVIKVYNDYTKIISEAMYKTK